MELKIIKFLIFIFYIYPISKQYPVDIRKYSNLQLFTVNLFQVRKNIIELNCSTYFKDDDKNLYLSVLNRYRIYPRLYIFYNKSKINTESYSSSAGNGYDEFIYLKGSGVLLNLKSNIVYLVFIEFYDKGQYDIKPYYLNGYYNISNLNKYYFVFPVSNFIFTFSYKKNNKNLISFQYNSVSSVKTILYNKYKREIKLINETYGGFSFIDYYDMDEFFIKIEVKSCYNCNITFIMEDYPNINYLSQEDDTIKFNTTIYSSYIFLIDLEKVPESTIYIKSKVNSIKNKYLYYFCSNIRDIEELKGEFLYKLNNKDNKIDGLIDSSLITFTISLKGPNKILVFKMNPKLNDTDFYVKSIFYSSTEIDTNINYDFEMNYTHGHYHIFYYKQKKFFNNNDNNTNGFIYSIVNNADKYSSLYIYNDINDLYIKKIDKYYANLKEKNWKSINYTSGDIYFLIIHLFSYVNKKYSFMIKNNNEYYDISNNIEKYSNFSFSMKFNNTKNQYITFSICPDYNYYIYFNITPSNLNADISNINNKNNSLAPIDNKYYLLNKNDTIYFKIVLSSNNDFSEFNVNIQKINELPKASIYLIIGIIILGVIQIVMFIVYIIKLKCKNKKEILDNQIEMIN